MCGYVILVGDGVRSGMKWVLVGGMWCWGGNDIRICYINWEWVLGNDIRIYL